MFYQFKSFMRDTGNFRAKSARLQLAKRKILLNLCGKGRGLVWGNSVSLVMIHTQKIHGDEYDLFYEKTIEVDESLNVVPRGEGSKMIKLERTKLAASRHCFLTLAYTLDKEKLEDSALATMVAAHPNKERRPITRFTIMSSEFEMSITSSFFHLKILTASERHPIPPIVQLTPNPSPYVPFIFSSDFLKVSQMRALTITNLMSKQIFYRSSPLSGYRHCTMVSISLGASSRCQLSWPRIFPPLSACWHFCSKLSSSSAGSLEVFACFFAYVNYEYVDERLMRQISIATLIQLITDPKFLGLYKNSHFKIQNQIGSSKQGKVFLSWHLLHNIDIAPQASHAQSIQFFITRHQSTNWMVNRKLNNKLPLQISDNRQLARPPSFYGHERHSPNI